MLCYVFFIPTFAHGLVCVLRLADRGLQEWKDFLFFFVAFVVGVVFMLACCFLFVHWIDGLVFLGAIVFFCYVAA